MPIPTSRPHGGEMPETLAIRGGPAAVPPGSHRRWPDVRPEDREAVLRVLDRGVLSAGTALDQGVAPPEAGALESEFARFLGIRRCLALNSGTAALHCCAAAVGVEPGDEVVVPALSFVSSALAVAQQGATPVFADIDPQTFNIDPRSAAERVGERTRALLAVHLHGLPAAVDELTTLADERGIWLIEDAAQAHGALYQGRPVGTLGHCSAFSLNVSKNLAGGEGGIFATNRDELALVASRLSNFGEDAPPPVHFGRYYRSYGLGWNYRGQELSAAFARCQLRRLDGYNARARGNAARLSAALASVAGLVVPQVPEDCTPVFHLYRLGFMPDALGGARDPSALRDRIIQALLAEGVPSGTWQHQPLPAHPVFRRGLRTWHPRGEREPMSGWDPGEYPQTVRVLAQSLIIGSATHPLRVQDPGLMDRYAEAIEKVVTQVDRLPPAPPPPDESGAFARHSSSPRRIASATAAARSATSSFS
jgi:perosamine synthetase